MWTTNSQPIRNRADPFMTLFCSDGGSPHEEYLTIAQLAERLSLTAKTIRNKMSNGIFKRGTHYFSREGMGPRFKWSAVKAWLESESDTTEDEKDNAGEIPMSRGYVLGRSQRGGTKLAH